MKLLITLFGLVLILEGLPYLAAPEAMQRWFRRLLTVRSGQMRAMGLIAMVIGFVLCYLGQRTDLFG
jgi:uncharacterized protein